MGCRLTHSIPEGLTYITYLQIIDKESRTKLRALRGGVPLPIELERFVDKMIID